MRVEADRPFRNGLAPVRVLDRDFLLVRNNAGLALALVLALNRAHFGLDYIPLLALVVNNCAQLLYEHFKLRKLVFQLFDFQLGKPRKP